MKKRYRGEFNWHGEIHILYTYATSHDQARRFLLTQLSKKLKRTYEHLSSYYGDDEKGNVYIVLDSMKKNAYSTTKSLPSLQNIKQELLHLKTRGYNKEQLKFYLKKIHHLVEPTINNILKKIYTNPVKWFVGITKDTIKSVVFFDKENINKTKYNKIFSHIFGSFPTKEKARTFADLII